MSERWPAGTELLVRDVSDRSASPFSPAAGRWAAYAWAHGHPMTIVATGRTREEALLEGQAWLVATMLTQEKED